MTNTLCMFNIYSKSIEQACDIAEHVINIYCDKAEKSSYEKINALYDTAMPFLEELGDWNNITNSIICSVFSACQCILENDFGIDNKDIDFYVNGLDSHFYINKEEM